MNIFLLFVGLLLLYVGSDWLVRGASSLALSFSIRPIIVGLTVVALGTSAPELLVSLVAAAKGSSGVSVGNIIGSNIINIALILGLSAMVRPLEVDKKFLSRELPYLIGVSFLFWILCLDGRLDRVDGSILLAMLVVFLFYSILTAKEGKGGQVKRQETSGRRYTLNVVLVVLGLACLAKGADMMVVSAIAIARKFGLSEVLIGLTIVALGTSLPELATSVVAVAKGESDISIGNVVGSNLFNICLVMGLVGILNPVQIDGRLNRFEFPVMLILTVLLLVFARSGFRIQRVEGMFFASCFFIYIGVAYWLAL
ncbi:MAG: calcium/sodium antiporter [Desulfobacterales bacterium]|uniref:Calcium/sodium antiporter n=1 Tax=Candidatus Desulfatibia vada TaxID=2841696 RepID=A0A8J6TT84_9BACT|nr:calcium/sodium antiporter [Candidatus Desulfatibia vada]MBL6970628.1 calcium/sodium antiporter [Desulfobacterales bacterium]